MNNRRYELIDALLALGKQAERVAGLLANEIVQGIDDDANLTTVLPGTDRVIDPVNYADWPILETMTPEETTFGSREKFQLDGLSVLEYNRGPTHPVSVFVDSANIQLITDSFKFKTQPPNVKIINQIKNEYYDVGIIWESLEFLENPAKLLAQFKGCCKKIFVRFRPWTSRNGGFLNYLAFAHLVRPVTTGVLWKVIRPLATYAELFSQVGLTIQEQKVNSEPVEPFFQPFFKCNDILATIIDRTWGGIRPAEALRIMTTTSIDYVVTC